MLKAIIFGFIGGSALLLGALIGLFFKLNRKIIATIMAFGAGVLICTLSFNLMEEAYMIGGLDSVSVGFLLGAILFVLGDWLVVRKGGRYHKGRKLAKKTNQEGSGMAIFIGALIDGIPESIAIGVGLLAGKGIGFLMLVAVFLSNLPEGISSSADMLKSKKSKSFILALWTGTVLLCTFASFLGYTLLGNSSNDLIAFILALAAGGILAMIVNTMIPESFKEEGKAVAFAVVFGFLVTFIISRIAK